jgi:tetratricopeptide (TPR) repeat protein
VRAAFLISAALLMGGGCAAGDDPRRHDQPSMRTVALPALSRFEESVQAQLRERHEALTAKQSDPRTPAGDLATEYGEMGKLLLAAELLDPAEAALLNAQALAVDTMTWPYYLGHLYRKKGDVPKATVAFERALRLAPNDVPTMTWLGEAALDQGRPDAGEPLFAKAVSLEPRSAAAHYSLGRAALGRKDYVGAARHLEEALALDEKASVIHYSLAMAYRGLGDQRRAELHLQQRGTLQTKPDPLLKALDELLNSALTYERNADVAGSRGEWSAAAEYLRKAVALAPTRASPHHKLGTALFYLKDRVGAAREFEETLRLSPGFAAAHYALGVLHEEDGAHQRAIGDFSAALASDPVNVDARLGLANSLRRSGQLERSLSEYERILKVDSGVVGARFGYAAALVRLNRYRDAGNWLTEAMALYPNELAFARAAARVLAAAPDSRVRDGARAMAIARALQGRQPPTIELAEIMAMAAAETGQYGDAVRWQRQALEAAAGNSRRELLERLSRNLKLYEEGRPCRSPWQAEEPIEFSR